MLDRLHSPRFISSSPTTTASSHQASIGSQPSRGGVWYSADGDVWVEPASEVFEAKTILGTAATDDAFYVLTTADISDEQGTFSLYGDEVYRSTNGTDWTATDQSDATVTVSPLPAPTCCVRQRRTRWSGASTVLTGSHQNSHRRPDMDTLRLLSKQSHRRRRHLSERLSVRTWQRERRVCAGGRRSTTAEPGLNSQRRPSGGRWSTPPGGAPRRLQPRRGPLRNRQQRGHHSTHRE